MGQRVDVDVRVEPEKQQIYILLSRETVTGLCMGLSLLAFDLIDALQLFDSRASQDTALTIERSQSDEGFARFATWSSTRSSILLLPDRAIRAVLSFLLRYYSDGAGDVDHIDLEADTGAEHGQRIYVTFAVREARAPASPEEAHRRLDV